MKIFGKEPAFWTGLVEAALALFLSLNVLGLTDERVSLVMAVVVAVFGVYTAWVTKDTFLGVGVGLAKAVLALSAGYGLDFGVDTTAAIIALVTVVLGGWQRTQTEPVQKPSFRTGGRRMAA